MLKENGFYYLACIYFNFISTYILWIFLDFIDVTADWDILFRQLDLLKDNTLSSPSSYPASVFPNVNK